MLIKGVKKHSPGEKELMCACVRGRGRSGEAPLGRRPVGGEGGSHGESWGESIPSGGHSTYKGPEAGPGPLEE